MTRGHQNVSRKGLRQITNQQPSQLIHKQIIIMHVKASFSFKISFGEGVVCLFGVFFFCFLFLSFSFCKYMKCFITVYRCHKRVYVTVGINTPLPVPIFFAKIDITQAKSPRVNFTRNSFHLKFNWTFHVNFTLVYFSLSREIHKR